MPGQFIINLLSNVPGTAVYHLLLFVALLPAAGILWVDWRRSHIEEFRIPLVTLGVVMGLHLLAGLVAPLYADAASLAGILIAPFLYGVELLSALLLVWCFGLEHLRERGSWLTFYHQRLGVAFWGWPP